MTGTLWLRIRWHERCWNGSSMHLERIPFWLVCLVMTASAMTGCASEDSMGGVHVDGGSPADDNVPAGWFRDLDGELQMSTCTAPDISHPPACGVVDGQPFYAFYDGCNWCQCLDEGGVMCTQRACDANEPIAFFFDFYLPGTPAPDETGQKSAVYFGSAVKVGA